MPELKTSQQSNSEIRDSSEEYPRSSVEIATRTLVEVLRQRISENASDSDIWAVVVEHIRAGWDSPFVAVRVVTGRGMSYEQSVDEKTNSEIWSPLVNSELTQAVVDAKPSSRVYSDTGSGLSIAVHSVPICDRDGAVCGAFGIVTDKMAEALCVSVQKLLSSYIDLVLEAGWLSETSELPNSDRMGVDDTADHDSRGARVNGLSATILSEFRSPEELAFSLTNSIKTRLNCIEVGLGVVRKNHVRLLAVSGKDNVFRNTPGTERITQAMEECWDQDAVVCAQNQIPDAKDLGVKALPIHQAWRAATQGSNCISIPLGEGGSKTAVVSLRRAENRPFEAEELSQLRSQLASISETIDIVMKARRGLVRHAISSMVELFEAIASQSSLRLVVASATVLLLVFGLFSSWPYEVMVDAKINSPEGQVYAAQVDGRLDAVHVKPGEKIDRGQLLFEMDVGDLETKLNKLKSEYLLHRVRMVDALNKHDSATANAERELAFAVKSDIAETERKIAGAKVCSQQAGVVARGDAHLRVGELLAFGTPVVQIANSDGYDVELKVADYLAAELEPGMVGWFAGQGEPERRRGLRISRLERQATVEEGQNLVSVWAKLDEPAVDLPVGATGFSQLSVGSRPGWWILLHIPLRELRWKLAMVTD